MAVYYTEFDLDTQSPKEEATYNQNLTKNIEALVPEEMRPSNFGLNFKYIPTSKKNHYVFSWKTINLPDIPEDICKKYADALERMYQANIRLMHEALKKNKWLKKHNIRNLASFS